MKHARKMPSDEQIRKLVRKFTGQTTPIKRLRSCVEWAVERAEEELALTGLPGSTIGFLQALVDDGKRLLAETEPRKP